MTNKKGGVDAPPSKLKLQRRLSNNSQKCQVAYYPQGVALKVSCPIVRSDIRGKRGKVVEWSSSSRRRLRVCLLTHSAPKNWHTFGVTLTVPGPPLSVNEMKQLWDTFRYAIKDYPIGIIWRLETQERGSVHWHLLCICSPSLNIQRRSQHGTIDALFQTSQTKHVLRALWLESVYQMGDCFHPAHTIEKKNKIYEIPDYNGNRMDIRDAFIHAFHIDEDGGSGSWLRYLQDHASKAKQEQIAVGFGRHWGMIGKRHFEKLDSQIVDMQPKQYYRFLRSYRRMCTPSYPNPKCVFGRSLGYRPSRGNRGTSVWFSKPQSVKNLQEWAMRPDFEPERCNGVNIYGRPTLQPHSHF